MTDVMDTNIGLCGGPRINFEFFPPKSGAADAALWDAVNRLGRLNPVFFSVTYGAGGGSRDRTADIAEQIAAKTGIPAAAHLACVGSSRDEIDEMASSYWERGIRHIVALRGDAQPGSGKYTPHPNGYPYAVDLVRALKRIADFEISVAAYPEVHPEAASAQADLDNLKRKIDTGATRAISQFFFEPERFLEFRDQAVAAGIEVPIVAGILPITGFAQVQRFAATCGATVPIWLQRLFRGLDDDPEMSQLTAINVTVEQCRVLAQEGVQDFHFYTLNRSSLAYATCHILGLASAQPRRPPRAAPAHRRPRRSAAVRSEI